MFRYVAPGLEEKLDAEIARSIGGKPTDSLVNWKRSAEMWELGARSPGMERNFEEIYTVESDGHVRPRRARPADWFTEVDSDMRAGLYFDTRIVRPALMISAMDTDSDRVRQFDKEVRRDLTSLVQTTEQRRREEIQKFRGNGSDVEIIEMRHTAHYCFVQRPREISRIITAFLSKTVE